MSDDKRLLDDPSLDDELKRALRAGRSEVPRGDRLAAIAAKLPPIGPGGGGGAGGAGGAAAPPAGLPFAAKALLAGVGLAAAVGAGVYAFTPPTAVPVPSAVVATTSSTIVVPPTPSAEVSAVPSSVPSAVRSVPTIVPLTTAPPTASSAAAPPDPKLDEALVDEAARLAATQPAAALAKCDEHAKLFPKSAMAEERERIAIEALVHLHREGEAHARATAFAKRFPGSAYQRRIEALFAD